MLSNCIQKNYTNIAPSTISGDVFLSLLLPVLEIISISTFAKITGKWLSHFTHLSDFLWYEMYLLVLYYLSCVYFIYLFMLLLHYFTEVVFFKFICNYSSYKSGYVTFSLSFMLKILYLILSFNFIYHVIFIHIHTLFELKYLHLFHCAREEGCMNSNAFSTRQVPEIYKRTIYNTT